MSYSIAEFESKIGRSSNLEAFCSCGFKAIHRDSENRMKFIVETFEDKEICLPCLTMKKICYANPDSKVVYRS